MPSAADKATEERRTFFRFIQLLGTVDEWSNIQSRDPPEPDLLCMHRVRGAVAFELVAITDPLIAQVNAGYGTSPTGTYSTSDPTERIIRKKLARKYITAHPIELLVYNDLLVITPDESIVATVVAWLDARTHPFVRAWFLGEHRARLIWGSGEA